MDNEGSACRHCNHPHPVEPIRHSPPVWPQALNANLKSQNPLNLIFANSPSIPVSVKVPARMFGGIDRCLHSCFGRKPRAAGWRIEILFEHNPEGQTDLPGNGPDYLRDVIRMSEPGHQCGGFDIRFSVAASSDSECQIQNRPGISIFASVPLVLTFVNDPCQT